MNNFQSLEVVDRVSETQLQKGENSDWIIWRLKGLMISLPEHLSQDMLQILMVFYSEWKTYIYTVN